MFAVDGCSRSKAQKSKGSGVCNANEDILTSATVF